MKKLAIVSCLMFSMFSEAGTWTDWGTVSEIQTHPEGSFLFKLTAPFLGNQSGSPDCGSGWYVVSDFTGLQKESISLILTAFTAGQDIRVNVSGCGGYTSSDTKANYMNIKK